MGSVLDNASIGVGGIRAIADFVQTTVDRQIDHILPARLEEYQRCFEEIGDLAYGKLNAELFSPTRTAFLTAGLKATPRLPGSFQRSREWGNADETHQQRWMWSIISMDGQPIGTLAVGSHHDHTHFRLPRSPEILAVEAVTPGKIVAEIAKSHPQFADELEFRQWYANYLSSQQPPNTSRPS